MKIRDTPTLNDLACMNLFRSILQTKQQNFYGTTENIITMVLELYLELDVIKVKNM